MLLLFSSYKSDSLWLPGLEHARLLSFTIPWSLLKLMFIESMMPSNHLILYCPFLLLPSIFPSIRVFSNELAPHIRWQSVGAWASASVLLMNIQGWFPLEWLVWPPCSSRDSQEYSLAPQFKNISSLALSLLHGPTLTSIYDYWKNHSF